MNDGIAIADLAKAMRAEAVGDTALRVHGASEPQTAGPHDLALAMSPAYAEGLAQGAAKAAVLWADADWQALGLKAAIRVHRPRLAMAGITGSFDPGPDVAPGVHAMAVVHESAEIGAGAAIGPFTVIGAGARIGRNARIASQVTIGQGVDIGDDALIHAGVRIGARARIGDRLIAQAGAVIGADGFSFVTEETSSVEQVRGTLGAQNDAQGQPWLRIASIGGVMIGDDVEIGANTTIDQGTIRPTRIGDGTKIDNLVHVGHNVIVGRHCLLCGQSGIAGSTEIGDFCVLGGQAGAADNIKIGSGAIIGAGAGVLSNVPQGRAMMGYPAVEMQSHVDMYKALRRLPRTLRDIKASQKSVSNPQKSD